MRAGQTVRTMIGEVVEDERGVRDDYEQIIRHYITPTLGCYRIDKLATAPVQQWLNDLQQRVAMGQSGTLTHACARH